MNVLPTPDGGLRILIKTEKNWELLRSILTDAAGCQIDLASRLGGLISEEAGAEDWHEYVVPDLREEFEDELKHVRDAINTAIAEADNGSGSVEIDPDHGFIWYSALNQARLALEEQFKFGPSDEISPEGLSPAARFAFLRSQIYLEIQSMLLFHVMQ